MSRFARKLLVPVCLLVLAFASRCIAADAPVEPKLTIINVASHCDWAWAHTRAWHEGRCANLIRDYLLLMRKSPQLVWQLETVNEELLPFLDKAARDWPGMAEEFWQRVREGRIEVVSGYSNPRLSEVYPELFVRSLVLGKEFFRSHVPGIQQTVLEVPDLMCGTSQVPQIVNQAGYRYFMFTRPVSQQAVFYRRGLDGTRMLCCKDVYGYPELQGKPGAAFPGIKPLPLWRYAVGQDDLVPTQAMLDQAVAGDPKRRIVASMLRWFQECEKYSDQITELSGVLDSCNYFTGAGLHGDGDIYTHDNRNEDMLLSLEKAQAMAAMLRRSFVQEPADELWREALSCCGHAIEWVWREDYAERMSKVRHTREKARRFLEESLAAVASAATYSFDHGLPLLAFNLHEWPSSGPVEFDMDDANGLVLCDANGQNVPLQFLSEDPQHGQRVAFNAVDVPACGFKTYYLRREPSGGLKALADVVKPASGKTPTIENDFYRISVQTNGRLEVFDKKRGMMLGAPQVGGFGDLAIYDMPPPSGTWTHIGPVGKRRDWQAAVDRCQAVQGPVFASLTIPGTIGGHAMTREVRLWRNSPRMEFGVTLDTTQRDNGVFCIRFPIGMSGKVAAGIPFGVEPRDDLGREPFRGESFAVGFPEGYDATRWTDVSSPEFGYTFICPPGMHTGYAFKKADQTIEFILDRFLPTPTDIFGRAASSVDGRGHHQWWCALLPHSGSWADAKSYRHALEQHVPLVSWSPTQGLGHGALIAAPEYKNPDRPIPDVPLPEGLRAGPATSLVEVSPGNVVLSAMRLLRPAKASEASPMELRLYETTGKPADVVVRLHRPAVSVVETNFLGETIPKARKIEIAGNELRFHIEPWKIVTLRVTD